MADPAQRAPARIDNPDYVVIATGYLLCGSDGAPSSDPAPGGAGPPIPQPTATPAPQSGLSAETCAVAARFSTATVQVAMKDFSKAQQLCSTFGASVYSPIFLYGDEAVTNPDGVPRSSYVPPDGLVIVWSVYPADARAWCSYSGAIPLN